MAASSDLVHRVVDSPMIDPGEHRRDPWPDDRLLRSLDRLAETAPPAPDTAFVDALERRLLGAVGPAVAARRDRAWQRRPGEWIQAKRFGRVVDHGARPWTPLPS